MPYSALRNAVASSSRSTLHHPPFHLRYQSSLHASPTTLPLPSSPSSPSSPTTQPTRQLKGKKNAITITAAAIRHLRHLLSDEQDPRLVRISVKTRGCAGMAYHLDYVPPPGGRFDEVVEQDGVKVLIDSKALFSIIGSRMDWRDNRLSAGFVFDNPNIVDTCGCGESFNIRF
nr:hypothetical protein L203_04162 [Cryptococcus depauperatus CBS 7841]